MTVTIEIEPIGAQVVVPVIAITIALVWTVMKCFGFGQRKLADPICTSFTDSLPALGDTPFSAIELADRRKQDEMKKQIADLEHARQLAFVEVCRLYARRKDIDQKIHDLKETMKKAEMPRDIGRVAETKKRIRHLFKEQEDCFIMVDDVCHRMYVMLMRRLNLRRKIDRIDMQMECDRLRDLLYPHVPIDLFEEVKQEVKKE
ncbi:hypothetical protein FGADI_10487 [Fusarium gaditjirri]|uniref:Uncharacterized protein n=1 Tax=Fusarium gaditjirri TaxID=282569 RepID=A0A8H4SXD2_9HYPO|nr:hypothetical protein FGADI_10487 [Fusarium gaditjirri]